MKIMKNKSNELLKEQLLHLIYGPGRNSYSYFGNFLDVADKIHGWQYWYLLRNAYQSADGLYIYREEVKKAFLKNEPEKSTLMTPYERRYVKSLEPTIKIYRGMTKAEAESGDFGVSWTLSSKRAKAFAFDYARVHEIQAQRTVLSLEVDVKDIIAYFAGSEREIIYIPSR